MLVLPLFLISRLINRLGLRIFHSKVFSSDQFSCERVGIHILVYCEVSSPILTNINMNRNINNKHLCMDIVIVWCFTEHVQLYMSRSNCYIKLKLFLERDTPLTHDENSYMFIENYVEVG